jgi:enoyl-CoA hydratase/carnithine racemase
VNSEKLIRYKKRDKIAYISINRPDKFNAFNDDVIKQMVDVWAKFKEDKDAWVAILSGEGDHFCVGAELHGDGTLPTVPFGKRALSLCPSTHKIWKPVIAVIWGYCVGGGWMLAQECDFRFAADDAIFGIPEGKWNLIPNFTGFLWRHLPPCIALEMLLSGTSIGAERAYEIGFINKVTVREQVMNASREFAEILCSNGPSAVRRMKELYYKGYDMNRGEILELTWKYFGQVLKENDTAEGINAFFEKRKPRYRGY